MKISTAEVGTKTEREVAEKLASGEARMVCGAVIERNDPTNGLNLRLNLERIDAIAAEIRRKREAR